MYQYTQSNVQVKGMLCVHNNKYTRPEKCIKSQQEFTAQQQKQQQQQLNKFKLEKKDQNRIQRVQK